MRAFTAMAYAKFDLLNKEVTYQQAVSLYENEYLSAAGFLEVPHNPGGDFYDFYENEEGKISFIIGDVSGKGQMAAYYMRSTKSIFRQLAKENLSASELIGKLNDSVSAVYDKLHFVTLTYLQVDSSQKQFSYIRAGHCPLLYYSATKNECTYFEDKGMGLGIIRDAVFSAQLHEYKMNYHANDVLVLFTDGFIEAVDDVTGNTFDMGNMKNVLQNLNAEPAEAICNGILNAFRQRVTQPRNPDDLALIVIKFA
jgi:serine phosphatase RsbU (regulator of sigma subunit)